MAQLKSKHDYVEMIYAPAKAYVDAIDIASRPYRRALGYSTASEGSEEVDQDAEAMPRKASYYLPASEKGKLAVQNAAVKRLLGSRSPSHKDAA